MVSFGYYRLMLWVIKPIGVRSSAGDKQRSWKSDNDKVGRWKQK